MSERDRELMGTAQGVVTLLIWVAMILGFMLVVKAKVAGATAIDCTVTSECSTISAEKIQSGSIEHEQWVAGSVVWPGLDTEALERLQDKIEAKRKRNHCTAAGEYDTLLAGVLAGNVDGYYLDADGSTIWSKKRERITRCMPADFDNKALQSLADLSPHHLSIGHWLRWTERWQTIERFAQTICRSIINPPPSSPVPEPSTVLLFGVGISCIALVGRCRASRH